MGWLIGVYSTAGVPRADQLLSFRDTVRSIPLISSNWRIVCVVPGVYTILVDTIFVGDFIISLASLASRCLRSFGRDERER
jgi:hypothetical protein